MKVHVLFASFALAACTAAPPTPSGSTPLTPQTDPNTVTGPTGPAGATGPTGAQGPKGDKGDPGDAGANGATGATGAQGLQGIQGLQGLQGLSGEAGAPGANGLNGEAGASGAAGEAGTPAGATKWVDATGATVDILGASATSLTILDSSGAVWLYSLTNNVHTLSTFLGQVTTWYDGPACTGTKYVDTNPIGGATFNYINDDPALVRVMPNNASTASVGFLSYSTLGNPCGSQTGTANLVPASAVRTVAAPPLFYDGGAWPTGMTVTPPIHPIYTP